MPILLFLHDPASIELAEKLLTAVPEQRTEDLDEESWSGVRILDEVTGACFASLRWVRGAPRDLGQAAHQLNCAVSIRADGEMYKPEVPKANRHKPPYAHDPDHAGWQSQQQHPLALFEELGIPDGKQRLRGSRR